MKVKVHVTLKKSVLDPQGETIRKGLLSLGYKNVEQVRQGKYFELSVAGKRSAEAEEQIHQMCVKLLSNPVIEDYKIDYEAEE